MKSEFVCSLRCLSGPEWNCINKNSGWQMLGTCRNTYTAGPSQDSAGSWKEKSKMCIDTLAPENSYMCCIWFPLAFIFNASIIHVLSSFALVIQPGRTAVTEDYLTIWILSVDFNCLPGNTFDHSHALSPKESLLPAVFSWSYQDNTSLLLSVCVCS